MERMVELAKSNTLVVVWRGASAGNSSRYYDVYAIVHDEYTGRDIMERLTWTVAQECDFRYDERREAIRLGGHGYSGPDRLIEGIAYLAGVPQSTIKFQTI